MPADAGVVSTQAIYSLEALMERLDVGEQWLRSARREGLRVRYHGKRAFVVGADLEQFLRSRGNTSEEAST
jgi:hypothetical protein